MVIRHLSKAQVEALYSQALAQVESMRVQAKVQQLIQKACEKGEDDTERADLALKILEQHQAKTLAQFDDEEESEVT